MRRPTALPLIVAALLLAPAPAARACGPWSDFAFFEFRTHPDPPFDAYAAGELGVLQPSFARSYLAVAYRYLEGVPTTEEDQATLVSLWERRLKMGGGGGDGDPVRDWLAARAVVAERAADLEPLDSINAYHPLEDSYYWNYLNCTEDSFRTATATLDGLVERHGEKNRHVQEWVRGQDQVFANCDGKVRAVPVVEAERAGYWSRAPKVFRQHRAYQIAAAHFYAGEYDDAHRRFLAIAEDRSSPWFELAPYLAARALVRKGMFAGGDGAADTAVLAQAEAQIQAVLDDPQRAAIHPAARGLDSYVKLYLHPEPQVHALAGSILAPTNGRPLGDAVDDYTRLVDRFTDWKRYEGLERQADPLTDWILTYQDGGDEARQHAHERWRETRSTAWLIAALSTASEDHPAADELLAHARELPAADPGFLTVRHLHVQALLDSGRTDEARALLDEVLPREDLPRSARNQLSAQRLALARDLDEVTAYLPRVPVCLGEDEIWAVHGCAEEEKPVLLMRDGAELLTAGVPLSVLVALAGRGELPADLRLNIARGGWTRAVLIGDHAQGVVLAQVLIDLVPDRSPQLQPYLDAPGDGERDEAALYALAWLPGMRYQVEGGLTRREWAETDSYRDNYWCAGSTLSAYPTTPAPFLDDAQRADLQRELAALTRIETGPNYLGRRTVEWAAADPDDPRVPEALHRAVKASRYGCTDADTGTWSKKAFQTLHGQYPDSPWTAETPYWYK